ncbi:WecB/TagA/CpsF family glycosyltransferase [Microbacterium sp. 1262]|uniref:WecB/TagA/CpsF family glycosyltransferase n=1 Tax=Microbacterium sp. 1262 TaxID=3156415 RepID=UPI0033911912
MRAIDLPAGLGRVNPLNVAETCDWVLDAKPTTGSPHMLGNLNLHALYLTLEDGPVRTLTRSSDVVLIDGWPILQLARMSTTSDARPTTRERIGSSDWLIELIARDPAIRVVAVGGTPETAEKMKSYVTGRSSSLRWRAFDGYEFLERGAERGDEQDLIAALGAADLILVGLGMPRQEAWILDHLDRMNDRTVVANVGGCFDYFAGTQKLAPRWMGHLGLEWLFRLAHSPRRLAGRYLLEPVLLVRRLMQHRPPGSGAPAPADWKRATDA